MDLPDYTCETCKYSGPFYELNDCLVVECRRNHPGSTGFPVMKLDSWCWDGGISRLEIERLRGLSK